MHRIHSWNTVLLQKTERHGRQYVAFSTLNIMVEAISAFESEMTSKTDTYDLQPNKVTVAEITFVEEGKTVTIRMDRPWGEDGIWIPREEM